MKRYKQYSFYWPQKTNFMNKPQEKKKNKKKLIRTLHSGA